MLGNSKIVFVDFEPTNGFRLYTHRLVSDLLDLAPTDAVASSSLARTGSGKFNCVLEIASIAGRFKARAQAENIESALERARRKILSEIALWKKGRFLRPAFA